IAGSGHQDVLGIALLVAALLLWGSRRRRLFRWTIPLALGALVKPVVVPAAAILLRGRPLRVWLRSALLGAITCVAVAGPLCFTQGGEPLANLGETASRFSRKWAHFGSVYEPVLWTIERATNDPDEWRRDPGNEDLWSNDEQEILARAVCLVLVGGVILVLLGTKVDAWSAARVLLFAMVLFSSTAHPWYLLWALAMMPRAPAAAAWLATLTLPWGYAQLGDVVEWHTPAGVMLLAYAPVYAVLAVDLVRTALRRRGRRKPPFA
ncbi:MAG: hypothetical protein JSW43_07620, partial [Gemmatimonadota bacterium]